MRDQISVCEHPTIDTTWRINRGHHMVELKSDLSYIRYDKFCSGVHASVRPPPLADDWLDYVEGSSGTIHVVKV